MAATISSRHVSFKPTSYAPSVRRTRVVKVMATQDKPGYMPAAFITAAAAALLVSSPAFAAPNASTMMINPQAEVAAKGQLAADAEGQLRAGKPGKAKEVQKMKRTFVSANKEDQASAVDKYPESLVRWRRVEHPV